MNRASRIIVAVIGIVLAIAGMDHGIFEILQGNTPTPGLIIQAIGPAHKMWNYGTEEAFSILPNFLLTGIAAIIVSLAIIAWLVSFIDTRHGATGLGLLFILLFLVGGGIAAQVVFAPIAWAAATRINKPLAGWRRTLSPSARHKLANLWPFTLTIGSLSFLIGLFIAITGYVPTISDPEVILNICWAFIFIGGLGMYVLTLVSGFAHDASESVEASTGFTRHLEGVLP